MRKPDNTRGKSVSLVVEGNVTPRSPCATPRRYPPIESAAFQRPKCMISATDAP